MRCIDCLGYIPPSGASSERDGRIQVQVQPERLFEDAEELENIKLQYNIEPFEMSYLPATKWIGTVS